MEITVVHVDTLEPAMDVETDEGITGIGEGAGLEIARAAVRAAQLVTV
jgi:hypothetical protein